VPATAAALAPRLDTAARRDYTARAMAVLHIDHVLSTRLLRNSLIFDDLIRRTVVAAPVGTRITRSFRPSRGATVRHYHRPTLERRLLPRSLLTVHHDLREPTPWLAIDHVVARCQEVPIVHCLNTTQALLLAEHGILHTRVIPHGVDRQIFRLPRQPRQWRGGKLRLGLFSRRHPDNVKGETLFAGLLGHLDPERVSFVLVGEDRWREAALARARGFFVEQWEEIPYRLMAAIIAGIDALLIVSRREGGPASLPEALGSAIPVFATPVGMCPDFVRDGDNGLMLTGEPGIDGARIMALLADHGRGVAALQLGAFATLGEIPSWQDVIARWYQLYAEIAAGAT
jgi:glycosyltransferase involved in cell wall biosynthesis